MDKDTAIEIMLNSFNEDTEKMCKQFGMPDEEIAQKIIESQQSIYFLLSNAYDKLEEAKGL